MENHLAHSILSMARVDGFENAFIYGKRTTWFKDKTSHFLAPGDIFTRYWQSGVPQLRKSL